MEHARDARGDAASLRAAAAGDRTALAWLIDDVGPSVYGFIYPRVGGDNAAAAEVLQDVFVEGLRSAPSFRGESAVSTWLCGIARHRVAHHWHAERKQEAARAQLSVVSATVTPDIGAVDQRDEVVRALAQIPATQRHVLILKYLDDKSVHEIAAELDRTEVQVQSLLQRARDSLRRQLEAPDA